ncbi:acid--CoA ligase [Halieaceae bacterium IMCC14734]|uniref:Acid--CoA ligase n=1 Tax=Candidatus Litorirhabdus singularis TaxID=2518993 RepID=A0ABT3TFN4_9GAMM|nr:AMP-binding protein [Candidatus Litorirhabdus singularis]MCX2981111.1 acid--CoA ligase [Candidatus Litorirhabdus singularis]
MAFVSFSRILDYWAQRSGDNPAVTCGERSVSFGELDRASNRLARAYAELGVKEGDNVTIALPNSIEFVEATYAVWKLGATPQPVSSRLPSIERDAIIEVAQSTLVVGIEAGQLPGLPSVAAGFVPDPQFADTELEEKTSRYMKAMTSGGSTGRPKLIVAEQAAGMDPQKPFMVMPLQKSIMMPGPLYHNGPFLFLWAGLGNGNHLVIAEKFEAAQTLELMQAHKIDLIYMVPTMMHRIWQLPDDIKAGAEFPHLRMVFHLAAPIAPWLKEAWIDWLGAERIFELYGGTEAQGFTVINGTDWLAHRGSVGRPLGGTLMKVVGDNGEVLPAGEVGEIYMMPEGGQGSTYHYVGAEAKADADGWESLGDMGYMDSEGYLYITDRQTDMILSGGANIYPAEVEGAIESFHGVRSCAVIGLPHSDLGSTVHAIVDMPERGEVSEEAVIAHLAERLVRYKIPRTLEFVSEPLRDDAGKVRRKALREARVKL